MYFVGIMSQVGVFSAIAAFLWMMTKMDAVKVFCISAMAASIVSLPILLQIERWINGVD